MTTFKSPDIQEVALVFHEISAKSPYSKELELYSVHISYVPADLCIEFEALESYLSEFAEKEITSEAMASDVADWLMNQISPRAVKVETTQESGRLEVISRAIRQDRPLAKLG